MLAFGKVVGLDLTHYHKDLCRGLTKSFEANLEFIKKLQEAATSEWSNQRMVAAQQPIFTDWPQVNSQFRLRKSKCSPSNYIILINSFLLLTPLENDNGNIPTMQEAMLSFGKVVGLDLAEYDVDLSIASTMPLEDYLEIFKKLQEVATSACLSKQPQ